VSVIRDGMSAWLLVVALLVAALTTASPAAAQLSDADVYVAEATLAVEDRQWDKALDLLRQALTKEPEHVEALYYTGVAYMGKKDPNQAIRFLEQARAKSPNDTSILYQLGLAHFALEQYDRSQPMFERAFAQDPTVDSLGYYVGYLVALALLFGSADQKWLQLLFPAWVLLLSAVILLTSPAKRLPRQSAAGPRTGDDGRGQGGTTG